MPEITYVQLAHRTGLNRHLRDSDLLRNLEVARVGDLDGAPGMLCRLHVGEVERERLGWRAVGADRRLLVVGGHS